MSSDIPADEALDFAEYGRRVALLRFKTDNEPLSKDSSYSVNPVLSRYDELDNITPSDEGSESYFVDVKGKGRRFDYDAALTRAKREVQVKTALNPNGPREGIYVPSREDMYKESLASSEFEVQRMNGSGYNDYSSEFKSRMAPNMHPINENDEFEDAQEQIISEVPQRPEPALTKSTLSERFEAMDISTAGGSNLSKWKNTLDLTAVTEEDEEEEEEEENDVNTQQEVIVNEPQPAYLAESNKGSKTSLFRKLVHHMHSDSSIESRLTTPDFQIQRESGNSLTTLRASTNSLENPVPPPADYNPFEVSEGASKQGSQSSLELAKSGKTATTGSNRSMAKFIKTIKSLPNKFYRGESNETVVEGSGSSDDLLNEKSAKETTKTKDANSYANSKTASEKDSSKFGSYKDELNFSEIPIQVDTRVMNAMIAPPNLQDITGLTDMFAKDETNFSSTKEKQPLLKKLMMRKDKTTSSPKKSNNPSARIVKTETSTQSSLDAFPAAAEAHSHDESKSIIGSVHESISSKKAQSLKSSITPERASSGLVELDETRVFENNYKIVKKIGCGGHSTVQLGLRVADQTPVVCKIIKDSSVWHWVSDSETGRKIPLEIKIMRQLCANNYNGVIKYIEHYTCGQKFVIVMEYLGQDWIDLYDYVELYGPVEEDATKEIFTKILGAVDYLHRSGYTHNDIKDENIMINAKTRQIKLIDFGSATPIEPDSICEVFYGTKKFACPEAALGKSYRPGAQETWALGTLLYVLLFRMDPFKTDEEIVGLDIRVKIEAVLKRSREQNNNVDIFTISDEMICLLEKMLNKRPENRPRIPEVIREIAYIQ